MRPSTIENINCNLEQGKDVEQAILDGAQQIALPALVSTLAICIVFVPMFLLAGIAKYLFMPLAEAVVFAMLASYLLSRTLVPTLAKFWLKRHDRTMQPASAQASCAGFQARFEQRLRALARALSRAARACARRAARASPLLFLAAMAAAALLAFPLGRPARARPGFLSRASMPGRSSCTCARAPALRIEETAALCDQVEATHPPASSRPSEIDTIVDNIGLPYSGINLAYSTSAPGRPGRCRHLHEPRATDHQPTARLRARRCAPSCRRLYPSTPFAFLPADIVSQILNFGLPAPLDVQVVGFNVDGQPAVRQSLLSPHAQRPGRRRSAHPAGLRLSADQRRCRPQQGGAARPDRARRGVQPAGVAVRQLPDFALLLDRSQDRQSNTASSRRRRSIGWRRSLISQTTPADGSCRRRRPQMLANLATIRRSVAPRVVSHYNATPVIDIYGAVQGTDLGFVAAQINRHRGRNDGLAAARLAGHRARPGQDHDRLLQRAADRACRAPSCSCTC